jgi:hypothetical protein
MIFGVGHLNVIETSDHCNAGHVVQFKRIVIAHQEHLKLDFPKIINNERPPYVSEKVTLKFALPVRTIREATCSSYTRTLIGGWFVRLNSLFKGSKLKVYNSSFIHEPNGGGYDDIHSYYQMQINGVPFQLMVFHKDGDSTLTLNYSII